MTSSRSVATTKRIRRTRQNSYAEPNKALLGRVCALLVGVILVGMMSIGASGATAARLATASSGACVQSLAGTSGHRPDGVVQCGGVVVS